MPSSGRHTDAPSPPVTPKATKASGSSIVINSTPFSEGLSSKIHTDNPVDYKQDHYRMYLINDWSKRKTIPLADYLHHILRISTTGKPKNFDFDKNKESRELGRRYSNDFDKYAPRANEEVATALVNSEYYKKLILKYCAASGEKARYEPFCELANHIVEVLEDHRKQQGSSKGKGKSKAETGYDRIVFARNDPKIIKGSRARRSPDVVAIRESIRLTEEKVNRALNWSIPNQNPNGFYWPELLLFVEFEKDSNLTKDNDPKLTFSMEATAKSKTKAKSKSKSQSMVVNVPQRSSGSQMNLRSAKKRAAEEPAQATTSKRSRREDAEDLATDTPEHGEQAEPSDMDAEPVYTQSGDGYNLKCTSYAVEMFTEGGLRTLTFGFLITGTSLRLCSYQRSRIIVSTSFNFIKRTEEFIAIIEALSRFDNRGLGISQLLVRPSAVGLDPMQHADLLVGATLTITLPKNKSSKIEIKFTKLLYFQRALIGRGSFVAKGVASNVPFEWLKLLSINSSGKIQLLRSTPVEVIIKASSMPQTRTPEYQFINEAVKLASKTKGFLWALVRLPTVLYEEWSDKMEDLDEHELRSAFALAGAKGKYELRQLKLLVMEPLFPITEITSGYELLRVYIDHIQVHKFLVKELGILHRDISLNNLMYRVKVVGGVARKYGVLNDFDLATYIGSKTKPHQQRTGTQPFMAVELLIRYKGRHYSRHDLESFYYVVLWHVTRYHGGKEIKEPPWQEWADKAMKDVYQLKRTFWSDRGSAKLPTPDFLSVFYQPLQAFRNLISNAKQAQETYVSEASEVANLRHVLEMEGEVLPEIDTPVFNFKTSDDKLTHDLVLDILEKGLRDAEAKGKGENVVAEPDEVTFSLRDEGWQDADEDNERLLDVLVRKHRGFDDDDDDDDDDDNDSDDDNDD